MNRFLAIDIGASSGRHIVGWIENDRLVQKELYRFQNDATMKSGTLCWDINALRDNVIKGLKVACSEGFAPQSAGVDTWGVDFVLLDENDELIGDAVCYRDERTTGMDKALDALISPEELYARTGIQKQIFNTIYQLMALKLNNPELLERAQTLLMMPDYLHFVLCGAKKTEYTEATTAQLINPETRDWDWELIERLGLPKRIFMPIVMPGTKLGELRPELAELIGASFSIVAPATHDTGSAVLAVPFENESGIYISSGTWSLMGIERKTADCSELSRSCNFTNEGGFGGSIRYLTNIMGLWMIQSLRAELDKKFSFDELCSMAQSAEIKSLVDCNDRCFLAPKSMSSAIIAHCAARGEQVPETPGELAAVIYNSLAQCYAETAQKIEKISGKCFDTINIVGGGSNDEYLNRLTARVTGKTVFAGPKEGTAIGNICAQMIAAGEFNGVEAARKLIFVSSEIKIYK